MSTLDLSPAPGAAPLVRMVRAQAALEVRLLLRNGEQLVLAVVLPLLVLVAGVEAGGLLDLGPGRRVDLLAPGVLALAVLSTAFTSLAIATGFERRYGVLKRLGATPLPRAGLLAGKALAVLAVEACQLTVLSGVALALGWRPTGGVVGLLAGLVAVLLGTGCFAALGLALAGSLRAEATLALANLVHLLLLAGGAVVVPLARHPDGLEPVLRGLPSGALADALRAAATGGGLPVLDVVVLLAWTAAGAAVAVRTFRWGVSEVATRGPGQKALRSVAVASLVANIGIVLTGGAVRLTGSGLGCPTWPRCTEESYVARGELGAHEVIEFGNRLLTVAVAAVAVVTVLVVWRAQPVDRVRRRLAVLLALGVPAQAVLGGMTVLTGLDPWLVAWHLLLSMALIALSVLLLHHVERGSAEPVGQTLPGPVRVLAFATYGVVWLVLYLGTVVTGSGPHAGDANAPRTGLDPATVSQLHADAVFLLVGLTVGLVLALRAVGADARAVRGAGWLLAAELAQGVVGFVQYATDLPVLLVELHLLGACLTVAAATWLLLSVRVRERARQPLAQRSHH